LEFLYDFGLFLAQAVTLVIAILVVVGGLFALGSRQKKAEHEGHIEIRNLNEKYKQIDDTIRHVITDDETLKVDQKAEKKAEKEKAKAAKKQRKKGGESSDEPARHKLFILDFKGDLKASATDNLREEISAVLPGGLVHGYGLAASQLSRIRDAGATLTVAVDKVAASGGYMMACVASQIISAPFAVIGSIGVLAQLPNFHRLLKKHDIDFELLTAGEYKRTLTIFGENTDKGREKFIEELEKTHELFKHFVSSNRPQLDMAEVATGEVWYGQQAVENGLVDDIQTSDAFVQSRLADWDVYEVRFVHKKNWQEKLGMAAEGTLERSFLKLWQHSRGNNTHS
jgi:serine protease SohB